MLIPDSVIIELFQWFKTKPTKDLERRETHKLDFVMYNDGYDGEYGNCHEIEVCKWVNPGPDREYLYEYEVFITAVDIHIDIAVPYTRLTLQVQDYLNLSEEEMFQYTLVHDIPYISPESLVLLAELSTLLQEEK